MNFLAFNTTGNGIQFVLKKDDKQFFLESPFSKHSESFFPLLEKFLDDNNCTKDEIDCFGVVNGPGSFTGIRIGLSVIKMFAFVSEKPCVVVNALEMLAYNIFEQKETSKICAVINAGGGRVYYQLFEVKETCLQALTGERVCTFSQFERILSKLEGFKIVYCENGEKKNDCEFLKQYSSEFCAKSLFLAINAKIAQRKFTGCNDIKPVYIRFSQAENMQIKEDCHAETISKENIDQIAELEKQSAFEDTSWSKKALCESLENENVTGWVFKDNEKIYGYLLISFVENEIEILRIFVDEKARGQQVAQRLLDKLFDFARSKKANVFLEVNQYNFSAILLYEKMGFVKVGERPKYYHQSQDALIMKKSF